MKDREKVGDRERLICMISTAVLLIDRLFFFFHIKTNEHNRDPEQSGALQLKKQQQQQLEHRHVLSQKW